MPSSMGTATCESLVGRRIRRLGRAALLVAAVWGCGATESPSEPGRPDCLDRATFGSPAQSPYVLPYTVGEAYLLSQSYCFALGGHQDQLAYDFDLPIGTAVLAVRSGVVRQVREDSPDDGLVQGEHNFIYVEHDDGTVAFYAHLRQNGVDVQVGDMVSQGQRFGASGNSGRTSRPHLHFGVYRSYPPSDPFDVAVNFRNVDGPIDQRGGLVTGAVYGALPW